MARSTKELSKELYLKGFNLEKISEILERNVRTIRNYKAGDGDWDELKATQLIANAKSSGETIYGKFIEQMYLAIKEISEDGKLNSAQKADALSQVGDSFAKMRRVANLEDPKTYKLGVAKAVIRLIVARFQSSNDKETLAKFVELLEDKEFIRAIEGLE